MTIFAISLERTTARREHIAKELREKTIHPWQFIGIDGAVLHKSGVNWLHNAKLRDGEVGCALSHAEACKQISTGESAFGVVIEDDVILPTYFDAILASIADKIQPDDVIVLYNRCIQTAYLSAQDAVPILDMEALLPMESRFVRTTAAYAIGRRAARAISEFNVPAKVVADDWSTFFQRGLIDSIRVLTPSPIVLKPFASTLSEGRGGVLQKGVRKVLQKVARLELLREARRRRIEKVREANFKIVPYRSDLSRSACK